MKKKSFWQRTNRGFWVSMVLLLAVVLYSAATQLMLIPQRKEIQELSDAVNKIWEETTLMTDEQAAALNTSKEKQDAVKARIRQGLSPLFVEGSSYLDSACDSLMALVQQEYSGQQRTKTRVYLDVDPDKCNIIEDTAQATYYYANRVSGRYYDYYNGEGDLKDMENIRQTLSLSLICQKVKGEWKIYRISGISSNTDTRGDGFR